MPLGVSSTFLIPTTPVVADSAGSLTNQVGLDECRGHEDDDRGYHYHVASPGENMFIGCFQGKTVEATETTTTQGPPAGGPPPQ